jgi:hypothetical protein
MTFDGTIERISMPFSFLRDSCYVPKSEDYAMPCEKIISIKKKKTKIKVP